MVFLVLVIFLAYLAAGVNRLRWHPGTPALLLAIAGRPGTGLATLAARLLLWPLLLRAPRPAAGAQRL